MEIARVPRVPFFSQDADFSLSKLMAGIVQILAIAVPLMAYFIYHTPAEIALQL